MPKAKTKSDTANIYGVVGSDEGEVKRVAAELAEKLVPQDAGDFGLEVIDGAADNAEQADARIRSTIEALQTLPFFGAESCVAQECELPRRRSESALGSRAICA